MPKSILTSAQKYAAAALLSLALRRAQIDQFRPFVSPDVEDRKPDRADASNASDFLHVGDRKSDHDDAFNASDCSQFWTHKSHGLLRPVFQFLEIDAKAWPGLEKTASSSSVEEHAQTFLKIVSEEDEESSTERANQERYLAEAINSMALRLENASRAELTDKKVTESVDASTTESVCKYNNDNFSRLETIESAKSSAILKRNEVDIEKNSLGEVCVSLSRKVTLLFELLSACVADTTQNESPIIKKGYDARHRTALRLLATWLDVKWIKLEAMEIMLSCSAIAAMKDEKGESDQTESEETSWSWKRGGIIGAAALTGGTLMAITGGLAAPAIAAGVSAIAPTLGSLIPAIGASGFAAVASAAGSAAGSVAVAASFGVAGAGLSGSKMARRIGDVEEFEFKAIGENHNKGQLAVGILVSGFITGEEDFIRPWERTSHNLERYALQWESKNLIAVSTAIQDWLKSKLTLELMKQGAMMTVLNSLVAALAWPTTLLSAIDFIDSKWSIAIDRSDKAGSILAEVLSNNLQGSRPVTLIGFSLGARVIFQCLKELAQSGEAGLVETIVLLGAPITSSGEEWECARKVVAGRFVNVYSTNDWILGVTFRASLLSQGLAGIQAVEVPGIENVDATHLIDGHSSYLLAMEKILQQLQIDSYYPVILPVSDTEKNLV